jgi:hypothetical protein
MTIRAGQKVVCIAEIEIETPWGTIYDGPVPQLDATYTVTGFGDTGMQPAAGNTIPNLDCGITVAELRGPRARPTGTNVWRELTWPIAIFRPLDERQTGISIFTGMLTPQREDA